MGNIESSLIWLIQMIVRLFFILLIIDMLLSFFVDPYHPLRQGLDRVFNPLLAPIRRYIRPVGNVDLSPLILILFVQIIGIVLTQFVRIAF